MTDILTELCGISAPSGYEHNLSGTVIDMLSKLTDKVEVDSFGNVLGFISCGDKNAPTLMLDAHLDEVGIIITGSCKNGFLRFHSIGKIDPRILPASEIYLNTSPPVTGIVTCLPPHISNSAERDNVTQIENLYIDTGGLNVPVGTYGTFKPHFTGMRNGQISAKSLDNRASFAVLLKALKLLRENEKSAKVNIVVCGSAQEEVGCRGARPAAYSICPQYALVLDATFGRSADTPAHKAYAVGGGACIGLGPECNGKLTQLLIDTAIKHNLNYQLEVMPGHSGTNATVIQIVREGVATAILSIPVKYMHTPVEMISLEDMENTSRLIAEWVVSL